MPAQPLSDLLDRAMTKFERRRFIWLRPGYGFDHQLEAQQALILGGAPTPRLLRREPENRTVYDDAIPYARALRETIMLLVEDLSASAESWLPFLEEVATSHRSLLMVSGDRKRGELGDTLVINADRSSLAVAIAGLPAREPLAALAERIARATGCKPRDFALTRGDRPSRRKITLLPRSSWACIRQDASLVLPPQGADWSAVTEEVAVIRVGGRCLEEQRELMLEAAERLFELE